VAVVVAAPQASVMGREAPPARRPLPCRDWGCSVTKVIALMSMSVDGYVADASDGVAEVFDWYFSGDVEVPTASATTGMTFRVSAPKCRPPERLGG